MLLSSARIGEVKQITGIWLDEETRDALEEWGIAVDSYIYVAIKAYDAFIIYAKGNRLAIGGELARKIMVK